MDPTLDILITFFVIMMVMGVLSWIVSIAVVIWFAKKVAGRLISELNNLMPELEKMGREFQDQINDTGSKSAISETDRREFAAKLMRAAAIMNQLNQQQARYRQLNQLSTQRYQLRLGELHSVAAQAGISWSPRPY